MSREHLIVCGSARPTGREKAWRQAEVVHLDTMPVTGNVRLRISDITDRMVAGLPAIVQDLIELAAYVYAADQASGRGTLRSFDYGHAWRRRFRFEVPVKCPDVWRDPRVTDELVRTLSFVSDDDYEFAFVPHTRPVPLPEYLQFDRGSKAVTDVREVVLFSGGMDSLGGAVEEALVGKRKVALVSHRPVTKIEKRQTTLRDKLIERAGSSRVAPFHVPVLVNKQDWEGKDYTQRTRSFLFASFAAAVARLFDLDRIRFYENGVVSCNLPICAQVLGGRASRTTHPQVLGGYERLFGLLFDRPFGVENPFFTKTKTDVARGLRKAGHADLAALSVSCAHTHPASSDRPHCGTCSQCVDRRLATLAAGYSEAEDPPRRYRTDLLTGHLDDVLDMTMVERIVGTAREIEAIPDATSFLQWCPEVGRLLRQIPGSPQVAAEQVFQLHKRHAAEVTVVVDREGAKRFAATWRGDLPPTCLIRLALGRRTHQPEALRPPGTAAGQRPRSPYTPSDEDVQLLRTLAGAGVALHQADLMAGSDLSRATVSDRMQVLLRWLLVRYPHGPRSGAVITDEGRDVLARAEGARKTSA